MDEGRRSAAESQVRYRELFESAGAEVPPDDDERHLPRARFHVELAGEYGPAELVEPIYVRAPNIQGAPA